MPEVVVTKPREGKFNKNAARRVRVAGRFLLSFMVQVMMPSLLKSIPSRFRGSSSLRPARTPSSMSRSLALRSQGHDR